MPDESRVKPQPLQPESVPRIWKERADKAAVKAYPMPPVVEADMPSRARVLFSREDFARGYVAATIEEARSPKKTRKFSELRAKMTPEAQAASEALASEMLSDLARREQPVRVTDDADLAARLASAVNVLETDRAECENPDYAPEIDEALTAVLDTIAALAAAPNPVRVTDEMAEAAHVVLSESCAVVFTGDYAEALSITTRAIVSALAAAPKEGL